MEISWRRVIEEKNINEIRNEKTTKNKSLINKITLEEISRYNKNSKGVKNEVVYAN
jgi:hypothetical protein